MGNKWFGMKEALKVTLTTQVGGCAALLATMAVY